MDSSKVTVLHEPCLDVTISNDIDIEVEVLDNQTLDVELATTFDIVGCDISIGKGDRGDAGPQGEKGDPGERGEKGEQGEKGEKGDTPSITHLEDAIDTSIEEMNLLDRQLKQAENLRVASETNRQIAESFRETDEIQRSLYEGQRQEQEVQRQQSVENMKKSIDDKIEEVEERFQIIEGESISQEVVNSRVDMSGFGHPSLDARLIRDFNNLNIDHLATKEELTEGLEAKSNLGHRHIMSDISGLSLDWSAIINKPTEFNPSQHGHDELHIHDNKSVIDTITSALIQAWNNKSDFSGNYNDLINKPQIPSTAGLATELFVKAEVGKLVDSSPEALDTLKELAEALGNDPNFATTIANQIGLKSDKIYVDSQLALKADLEYAQTKVDKEVGKQLSTNDFTNEEKDKLSNLENYIHPNTASIRHVTDVEKANWNAKADLSYVTDVIDNDIRNEIVYLQEGMQGKVDKIAGKQLSTNDFTNVLKTKLDGLVNYIHPDIPSIRHVTDLDKQNWNAKPNKEYVDGALEELKQFVGDGTISITKPILSSNEGNYELCVTIYGELFVQPTLKESSPLYLQSEDGTKWEVRLSGGALETIETSPDVEVEFPYLQTLAPYGLIFKMGILDDGALVMSPLSDMNIIDDSNMSQLKTWSSAKILNEMKIIKVPLASEDNNGLMSKQDKVYVDSLPDTLEKLKTQIRGEIDLTYKDLAQNAIDKVNAGVQGAEITLEETTNAGLASINNLIDTGYEDFEKIKQDAINAYDGKLEKSAITISTEEPTEGVGKHGDIWIVYGE